MPDHKSAEGGIFNNVNIACFCAVAICVLLAEGIRTGDQARKMPASPEAIAKFNQVFETTITSGDTIKSSRDPQKVSQILSKIEAKQKALLAQAAAKLASLESLEQEHREDRRKMKSGGDSITDLQRKLDDNQRQSEGARASYQQLKERWYKNSLVARACKFEVSENFEYSLNIYRDAERRKTAGSSP